MDTVTTDAQQPTVSFAVRLWELGTHTNVRVYAGCVVGQRAYAGSLTMRPAEAREFVALLATTGRVDVIE